MTNDEFTALRVNDPVVGYRRGQRCIAHLASKEATGRTGLRYASNHITFWSKSHIKKYYQLSKP